MPPQPYPTEPRARDRWILSRRGSRRRHNVRRAHSFFIERERSAQGKAESVLTVLLTSRECPWRCLMCDLWKFTVPGPIPVGAIPRQIQGVLAGLPDAMAADPEVPFQPRVIKLYNGGSFFDARAVPPADYPAIAQLVCRFERVIVECHPALVGERCLEFRRLLHNAAAEYGTRADRLPTLELALGLETAHPEVLEKLNKRMTLEQFRAAAAFLAEHGIALRVFILVKPPFLSEAAALEWAVRSLVFAFDCGATVAVLIPTRLGNGALEDLAAQGAFARPKLATLETALEFGLRLRRGRVLADLWDIEKFSECSICLESRVKRLRRINAEQEPLGPVECPVCEPMFDLARACRTPSPPPP